MNKRIILLLSTSITMLPLTTAQATGVMTCDSGDQSQWISQDDMKQKLIADGWEIRFMKEDGGCWEVYGTTPEGERAEAYFHPVTGEKLLVSQRGRVLFKAEPGKSK